MFADKLSSAVLLCLRLLLSSREMKSAPVFLLTLRLLSKQTGFQVSCTLTRIHPTAARQIHTDVPSNYPRAAEESFISPSFTRFEGLVWESAALWFKGPWKSVCGSQSFHSTERSPRRPSLLKCSSITWSLTTGGRWAAASCCASTHHFVPPPLWHRSPPRPLTSPPTTAFVNNSGSPGVMRWREFFLYLGR